MPFLQGLYLRIGLCHGGPQGFVQPGAAMGLRKGVREVSFSAEGLLILTPASCR